jgi:hypothetical protein
MSDLLPDTIRFPYIPVATVDECPDQGLENRFGDTIPSDPPFRRTVWKRRLPGSNGARQGREIS